MNINLGTFGKDFATGATVALGGVAIGLAVDAVKEIRKPIGQKVDETKKVMATYAQKGADVRKRRMDKKIVKLLEKREKQFGVVTAEEEMTETVE